MDWIALLKVVAVLIGSVVALVSLRLAEPRLRPRNRLKADLEILNLLQTLERYELPSGDYDLYCDAVQKEIDKTLARVYHLPRERGFKVHDLSMLVLGIIGFPGFSYWTWYLVKDGFSWWAIGTGFFAFLAFIWILLAFEKPGIGGATGDRRRASVDKATE